MGAASAQDKPLYYQLAKIAHRIFVYVLWLLLYVVWVACDVRVGECCVCMCVHAHSVTLLRSSRGAVTTDFRWLVFWYAVGLRWHEECDSDELPHQYALAHCVEPYATPNCTQTCTLIHTDRPQFTCGCA